MAITKEQLELALSVNSTGAISGIEGTEKALSNLEKVAQKTQATFSDFGASIIVINQAFEFASKIFNSIVGPISDFTSEFIGAQRVSMQLAKTLELTSTNAKESFEKFSELADELSSTTTATGDLVKTLAIQAKTTGLTNSQTEELIRASIDLGAITGDVNSAFDQLLKTYKGNVGLISIYDQRIKSLTDEQLASGEAVKLVAEAVKGQGQVLAQTIQGQLIQFDKKWANIKETLGEAIISFFNISSGTEIIINVLSKFETAIKNAIPIITSLSLTISQIDWSAIGQGVLGLTTAFLGYKGALLAVSAIQSGVILSTIKLAGAYALLAAKLLIISSVVAGAVSAVELLYNNFDKLDVLASIAIESIKNGFYRLSAGIAYAAEKFFEFIGATEKAKIANKKYQETLEKIEQSNNKISKNSEQIDFGVTGRIINTVSDAFKNFGNNLEAAKNQSIELKNALSDRRIEKPIDPDVIKKTVDEFDSLIKKANELKLKQEEIGKTPLQLAELQLERQLEEIKNVEKNLKKTGQLTKEKSQQLRIAKEIFNEQYKITEQEIEKQRVSELYKRNIDNAFEALKQNEQAYQSIIDANKKFIEEQQSASMTHSEMLQKRINDELKILEIQRVQLKNLEDAASLAGDFEAMAKARAGLAKIDEQINATQQRGGAEIEKRQTIFGKGGTEFLDAISSTMSRAASSLQSAFEPFIGAIGSVNMFVSVAQGIVDAIPNMLANIANLLNSITDLPEKILSNLSDVFKSIIRLVKELPTKIVEFLVALPEMVADFLFQKLPAALETLALKIPELIDRLINGLISAIPRIVEGFVSTGPKISMALINGFIKAAPRITIALVRAMPKVSMALAEGFVDGIKSLIKGIGSLFKGDRQFIDAAPLEQAAENLKKSALQNASQTFAVLDLATQQKVKEELSAVQQIQAAAEGAKKSIWQRFKESITAIWNEVTKIIDKLWTFFSRDLWIALWGAFQGVFTALGEILLGVWEAIKALPQAIFEFVSKIPEIISGFVKDFWKLITEGLWPVIKGIGEAIWKILADVFNAFVSMFNTILEPFKKIGTWIWNGIKSGIDAIAGFINNMWNGFADVFKSILNPFIKLINALKIPAAKFELPKVLGGGKVTLWNEIDLIPGDIKELNTGGIVDAMKKQAGNSFDRVPAMLTPGEFVMSRPAVNSIGLDALERMNRTGQVSSGETTVNVTVTINEAEKIDDNFIRNRLIPTIRSEFKRASLNGEFVLSARGIRE